MSVARADVKKAKSSQEDLDKVVAKVTGPLLAPSRYVVKLLSGLATLFPLCKQVSSALAALTKSEVNRHKKDVRVVIVHFDLASALVHIGSLNRKSRPPKDIADPLSKLLKRFKVVIQEFSLFCEEYYESRACGSALKHLQHRKWNQDLNSIADRISKLKKSHITLLSQQAVQYSSKYTDVLIKLESRVVKYRAVYVTIKDKKEEIAEASLSKSKRGVDVTHVQGGGTSSVKKKTTASTSKVSTSKVSTSGRVKAGEEQKDRVVTKSCPPERTHKQGQVAKTTHASARGHRTGQQQKQTHGIVQKSGQQFSETVNIQENEDIIIGEFYGVDEELPGDPEICSEGDPGSEDPDDPEICSEGGSGFEDPEDPEVSSEGEFSFSDPEVSSVEGSGSEDPDDPECSSEGGSGSEDPDDPEESEPEESEDPEDSGGEGAGYEEPEDEPECSEPEYYEYH